MIALLISLTMGLPILFQQTRPGLHGKPVVLYKLRTMQDRRDSEGNVLPDEERLPLLGNSFEEPV